MFRGCLVPVFGAVALAAGPATAQAMRDGKAFDGVFPARAKMSGDADTVRFRNGRFHSSACDECGDGDAPHRVLSAGGDITHFEAKTEGHECGKLEGSGVIRGEKPEATAMTRQSGKAAVENRVVAALKK